MAVNQAERAYLVWPILTGQAKKGEEIGKVVGHSVLDGLHQEYEL